MAKTLKTLSTVLLVITTVLFLGNSKLFSQSNYIENITQERIEFETELLHSDKVLNQEEIDAISTLNYFPIDTSWILTATFKKKKGKVFEMPTTTDRKPKYRRVGYLYFEREGEKFRLTVYKNLGLTQEEYANYYFIPFKDGNAPQLTYGGGRYLDIEMTLKEKTIQVDFNKAYNPYCVYSHRYSCPITPEENHISTKINAGIKIPFETRDD